MKIKLGGLQSDQASAPVQPSAMNIKLRKLGWDGGDYGGLS